MSVVLTPVTTPPARRNTRLFGLLSTYPPTPCGLATFSAALAKALEHDGHQVGIVRVGDEQALTGQRVLACLRGGARGSARAAATALNSCDIAVVQHDYGLYGGRDGDEVLEVMNALTVPSILVAHTVLSAPTDHQRQVLEEAVGLASIVVVMAETARDRLCTRFNVDPGKVATVYHGATGADPAYRPARRDGPMLLSWGLLGPGKGIEWAIDALEGLDDIRPSPRYVIAGRTHPKVLSSEGESYREMLMARARKRGLAQSVVFDPTYRDVRSLTHLAQDASIVLLPYDSHDQVTSGVLVDAIAAGRPVIATAFPHAVELLATGAGIVVPHGDVRALGSAIRRVLVEPGVARDMEREAARLGPAFAWSSIAAHYARLADCLVSGTEAVPA